MPSWLQNPYVARAIGKAGKAIDVIGRATGNIVPEFGLSEKAQSWGGYFAKPTYAQTPSTSNQIPYGPQRNIQWSDQADQDALKLWELQRGGPGAPLGGGGGGGGGSSDASRIIQEMVEGRRQWDDNLLAQLRQQTEDVGARIDRDFENVISNLGGQEASLRGQAGATQQNIEAQYAPARTQIGEEQAIREAGLTTQEQQAQTQTQSALQQARDLFRQVQQQNIAQLSGLGISSSSVAEALAERLGVETARRIAGVTGSRDEVLRNIGAERTRVQTYFQKRLSDLEASKSAQIATIQQQLLQGLNQVNSARQQAASDKANRRAELWTSAQAAINQINQNTQQFQLALQQWAVDRTRTLGEAQQFVINPADFGGIDYWQRKVSEIPEVGGFQAQPTFTVTPQGYLRPSYKYVPKKEEENDGLT